MSKRMLELQAMLEMQERVPVPPEQIIDKLDISATEKERWLEYIARQEQAAAKQQEELQALEAEFKDREIQVDEKRNEIDFILGMAKIKHMNEKDDKKAQMDLVKMQADEAQQFREMMMQVAQMAQDYKIAKEQAKKDGGAEGKKTKSNET